MKVKSVTLGMTGASGAQYGLRLLGALLEKNVQVSLLLSKPAQVVLAMETTLSLSGPKAAMKSALCEYCEVDEKGLEIYSEQQWTAPIASGSGISDAMVVCPCTTGTMAAIATGQSRSLMERAADVSLKERKPLVLVVRETPLSAIQLENMHRLSLAGATIMPASPGFYQKPETVEEIIDFMAARVLDQIGVEQGLLEKWGK